MVEASKKEGVEVSVSSTRINRLAGLIDAKTYLEIGVAEGDTFHNAGIGHKTEERNGSRFLPLLVSRLHTF